MATPISALQMISNSEVGNKEMAAAQGVQDVGQQVAQGLMDMFKLVNDQRNRNFVARNVFEDLDRLTGKKGSYWNKYDMNNISDRDLAEIAVKADNFGTAAEWYNQDPKNRPLPSEERFSNFYNHKSFVGEFDKKNSLKYLSDFVVDWKKSHDGATPRQDEVTTGLLSKGVNIDFNEPNVMAILKTLETPAQSFNRGYKSEQLEIMWRRLGIQEDMFNLQQRLASAREKLLSNQLSDDEADQILKELSGIQKAMAIKTKNAGITGMFAANFLSEDMLDTVDKLEQRIASRSKTKNDSAPAGGGAGKRQARNLQLTPVK